MGGGAGDDRTHTVDSHRDYVLPKEEPESEFATTDGGGGDGGTDGYCDYGRFKKEPKPELDCGSDDAGDDYSPVEEDPESKDIDVNYHRVKDESEPELGGDDGDDGSRDVAYDCCHCGINLCTKELKVEHETQCRDRMQRREFESQITEVYHCGYCRWPFLSKELKEQHQQKQCQKKLVAAKLKYKGSYFKCTDCEYVTKWKQCLQRHVLNHNKNNAEWFICTQCSYKTVHKQQLTVHMKIHGNNFTHCCPICGKSFRSKRDLDNHLIKQHSDESNEVSKFLTNKVYTCNMCSQFRTTVKRNLNEHVTLTHHKGVGCQKYECPHCPFSTFHKYYLKTHLKTHMEQKDYQCTICNKQFIQKTHLDSHVLHNHADNVDLVKTITTKIHCCELCSFKSVNLSCLKRHVQLKHT